MTKNLKLEEILFSIDIGCKELWDGLTDQEKKSVNFYTLNRFISNVKSLKSEEQENFVLKVNEYYNKHYFELQKHPKLLWFLLCLCNFNKQKFFHEWIPLGKNSNNSKKIKLLSLLRSDLKDQEIEVLLKVTTDDEFKDIARNFGWSEKEINGI
jgi:hypothetical protein